MDQDAARGQSRAVGDDCWVIARRLALGLYFVAVIAFFATRGVPSSIPILTVLAVAGVLVSCIGRGWRRTLLVTLDWAPFVAVLFAYNATRGLADSLGIAVHERDIVHAEAWLFGGVHPTVWLQAHLYDAGTVHWYDGLLTLVYTSHFVATPVLAAVLWLRDREYWLRYIAQVVLLSVAGLVTYVLFPTAPPWLAAQDGLTAPVVRLSARGWSFFGADHLAKVLTDGQQNASNAVAAMPSLHVAMAVLVALAIMGRLRSPWRRLLWLYPATMGFALVYFGEHWVLDLLAGFVYAVVTHVVVLRWGPPALAKLRARRAARRPVRQQGREQDPRPVPTA